MSLKRDIEKIEHFFKTKSKDSKRRGQMKKARNRWLRRKPLDEVPNPTQRFGWEY